MPNAKYKDRNYDFYLEARKDLDGSREYVKEWERKADTSKAQFACLSAVRDRHSSRVTSLWGTTLPDGRELYIISINRPETAPQYDRGLATRDEALTFFGRYQQSEQA